MAIPNKIILTGKIYIKYIDSIITPQVGDMLLLLDNDSTNPIPGDYANTKISGYIKAKIYDGLVWQNINIGEFCLAKENKFTKKQRAIDTAMLCQVILKESKGSVMYRSYRGHFTLEEYEPNTYNRKSSNGRRQKK